MPILFDRDSMSFKLDTPNSSYVLQVVEGGYLIHRHYGAKIDDIDLSYLNPKKRLSSFSPQSPDTRRDLECELLEYSAYGIGDYRTSPLMIRADDGTATTDIRYVSHKIYYGKPVLEGLPATYADENEARTLEILTVDNKTQAYVTLVYSVFEKHDAVARSVRVENKSDSAFTLERILSGGVDLPHFEYDMITLWGHWGKERTPDRKPLRHGKQGIESLRVSSSHNHNPFVAITTHNADEEFGDAYGFSFVYSGNFLMEAEVDVYGRTRFVAGINPTDFAWKLAPGETFTTPEVVMVYSNKGIGQMSRTFHKLFTNNLCRKQWRGVKRPILVNNWEGTYFDFDDEKLLSIAKDAADLGIEMFVLDDGWFGDARNSDNASLGDWFVNENKIKCGLPALVKKIHEMGLKFGLWFEPEMISPVSRLYEAHPDWCVHVNGRKCSPGRQQLVLDYTRQDVRDYIVDIMSKTIEETKLEYIKWDFNRNLSECGSDLLTPEHMPEFAHRYVLGLYEVLDRLLTKYPDLLIEGCSGGGGRFDAGMLFYTPQIWTSDDTCAIERVDIQYGTSYVYPASAMSAHVSASPNHQTCRSTPLRTRGIVAMGGNFGYELDLNKLTDDERAEVREQIADYNKYQKLVQYGDLYRLVSPYYNRCYSAWEYVSDDKSEALFTLVFMRREIFFGYYYIKLQGLDADKKYRSSIDGMIYSGSTLMNVGLNFTDRHLDREAILIHFTEVK